MMALLLHAGAGAAAGATGAHAAPCGGLAACARNMSVVVDYCGSAGPANQSWQLEGVAGPEPTLARVRLRSALSTAAGPLCAAAAGDSPDLPGAAKAVMLVPCSAATVWEHDPAAGHFRAAANDSCGSLDAGVYHVPPAFSAGANVVCYPSERAHSPATPNQVFKPVAGHAGMFSTECAGQRLCLTARLLANDHMPTPHEGRYRQS